MATSLTFLSANSACSAAPVPRPPQPTRPMRKVSSPAACAPPANASDAASVAPAEDFRKSRREAASALMANPRRAWRFIELYHRREHPGSENLLLLAPGLPGVRCGS